MNVTNLKYPALLPANVDIRIPTKCKRTHSYNHLFYLLGRKETGKNEKKGPEILL